MTYRRKILDINIDFGFTYDSAVKYITDSFLTDDKSHYICTTNPEFIMDAQSNTQFKDIINNADLSLPDGVGVLFAEKYFTSINNGSSQLVFDTVYNFIKGLYVGIRGLVTPSFIGNSVKGVELTYKLLDYANKNKKSVFLLGGKYRDIRGKCIEDSRDLASDALAVLKKIYPDIVYVGASSKYSYKSTDDSKTVDYVRHCMQETGVSSVDFLFVAYNHFNQESWIVRNAVHIPAKVSLGVGGTFDYIVGFQKMEPKLVSVVHMGWLYRLITQPWRIRRVYKAFPLFPFKIFLSTIK
jgi:N-acetylglucosaminyldiphosphoundecaprenol N-acetyl-beta-D-mannosaminyltransferase